jgi:hypothetical protein
VCYCVHVGDGDDLSSAVVPKLHETKEGET